MLENAFESGSGFEPLNQQMALAADWASFDIQIKNLFNWDLDINFKSNRKKFKKRLTAVSYNLKQLFLIFYWLIQNGQFHIYKKALPIKINEMTSWILPRWGSLVRVAAFKAVVD